MSVANIVDGCQLNSKTPRGCVTPGQAGPGRIWGNWTFADGCSRAGPVIRLWRAGYFWAQLHWRHQLFWVGRPKGGQDIFRGASLYVANNALPQYGTHTPLFQVPLPFPWSVFSLCFLWFLSFQSLFHCHLPPSPPLIQLGVWGSAVSSPSGSRLSPAAKWNLVNSGPWNERFLTCQSGKLQFFLNSLIYVFDSVTVSTVLVSSQMRYSLM